MNFAEKPRHYRPSGSHIELRKSKWSTWQYHGNLQSASSGARDFPSLDLRSDHPLILRCGPKTRRSEPAAFGLPVTSDSFAEFHAWVRCDLLCNVTTVLSAKWLMGCWLHGNQRSPMKPRKCTIMPRAAQGHVYFVHLWLPRLRMLFLLLSMHCNFPGERERGRSIERRIGILQAGSSGLKPWETIVSSNNWQHIGVIS
jgi:hypothetical protein